MPFIKAAKQVEGHIGRIYQHCTYAPDGSNWAAEVDEVKAGETEITAAEHAAILAANVQALADAVQQDKKTSVEEKVASLAALAETALLAPETKASLARIGVIGEPAPVAIAEVGTP